MVLWVGDITCGQLRQVYRTRAVSGVRHRHYAPGSWCWLSADLVEAAGHVLFIVQGLDQASPGVTATGFPGQERIKVKGKDFPVLCLSTMYEFTINRSNPQGHAQIQGVKKQPPLLSGELANGQRDVNTQREQLRSLLQPALMRPYFVLSLTFFSDRGLQSPKGNTRKKKSQPSNAGEAELKQIHPQINRCGV